MIDLTRVYRFSAAHRLDSSQLTASENQAAYGRCNNPFGHGHNYRLEVTVRGPVDAQTGRVAGIRALDARVRRIALDRLEWRDLNREVGEFSRLVPTTENLAAVIEQWLVEAWPADLPNLHRIRIFETRNNVFEIERL